MEAMEAMGSAELARRCGRLARWWELARRRAGRTGRREDRARAREVDALLARARVAWREERRREAAAAEAARRERVQRRIRKGGA